MALTKVQDSMIKDLDKSDVGLSDVDNTSDSAKPVSTATQTQLDLKAPLASPTFTGTVSGITKAMVGLGSVDNTSDASKPVSTATQTALDAKVTGPASVTADRIMLFDGTTGKLAKQASVGISGLATAAQGAKADTALQSVVAGTNITVDNTNPTAPVISASGGGGSTDIPAEIHAASSKATPVDADEIGLIDSAASWGLKKLTWANLKATLKTYFDTFYTRASLGLATSDSPQFTAINLGHASDTTLARDSAGVMSVEGVAVVTVSATQTLTAKTLTSPTLNTPVSNTPTLNNAITVESYAFNTSTNAAVDLANGTQQRATLTGNWTPGAGWPAATAGQFFELILLQDGTGSRTVTWPSSVKWPSSTAPTITATASKGDIIHFRSDGTNWLANVVGQVYL